MSRMGNGEISGSASSIRDIRVIRGFFVVEPDFFATVSKNLAPRSASLLGGAPLLDQEASLMRIPKAVLLASAALAGLGIVAR